MITKQNIAFFDFDGTITTADTMLELIKFHFGKKAFYSGMLLISPALILMKVRILSRQKAKEILLSQFFEGMRIEDFQNICKNFSEEKLPSLLRKEAIDKIENYKNKNVEVVVVTASAVDWVKYFCEKNQLSLIASELEVAEGKLTGKLKGINCNESEKVNRINALYSLKDFSEIHCYGDSKGDQAMLAIATHPFYKKF